jgi:hypothetical protein
VAEFFNIVVEHPEGGGIHLISEIIEPDDQLVYLIPVNRRDKSPVEQVNAIVGQLVPLAFQPFDSFRGHLRVLLLFYKSEEFIAYRHIDAHEFLEIIVESVFPWQKSSEHNLFFAKNREIFYACPDPLEKVFTTFTPS